MLYRPHVKKQTYEIADLDTALERIQQLEEAIGLCRTYSRDIGLTRTEERLLGVLHARSAAGGTVSYQSIWTALYGAYTDPPDDRTLKVHLHRIRKRLAPHGVQIVTDRGRGWYVPPESRAVLDGLILRENGESNG